MVNSLVLVYTMFALRLVPRGVAKRGVISKKRGIPCIRGTYYNSNYIPRYMPHTYPHLYHVICLFYAVTSACFVPINWVLDIVPPRPRPRPRRPPAARRPPPARPPLANFFFHWCLPFICSEDISNVHCTVVAADIVPASVAQDEAGPPPPVA